MERRIPFAFTEHGYSSRRSEAVVFLGQLSVDEDPVSVATEPAHPGQPCQPAGTLMFDGDNVRFGLPDGNLVPLNGAEVEMGAESKRASQFSDSPVRSDGHSAADRVAVELDVRLLTRADVEGEAHGATRRKGRLLILHTTNPRR